MRTARNANSPLKATLTRMPATNTIGMMSKIVSSVPVTFVFAFAAATPSATGPTSVTAMRIAMAAKMRESPRLVARLVHPYGCKTPHTRTNAEESNTLMILPDMCPAYRSTSPRTSYEHSSTPPRPEASH